MKLRPRVWVAPAVEKADFLQRDVLELRDQLVDRLCSSPRASDMLEHVAEDGQDGEGLVVRPAELLL